MFPVAILEGIEHLDADVTEGADCGNRGIGHVLVRAFAAAVFREEALQQLLVGHVGEVDVVEHVNGHQAFFRTGRLEQAHAEAGAGNVVESDAGIRGLDGAATAKFGDAVVASFHQQEVIDTTVQAKARAPDAETGPADLEGVAGIQVRTDEVECGVLAFPGSGGKLRAAGGLEFRLDEAPDLGSGRRGWILGALQHEPVGGVNIVGSDRCGQQGCASQ